MADGKKHPALEKLEENAKIFDSKVQSEAGRIDEAAFDAHHNYVAKLKSDGINIHELDLTKDSSHAEHMAKEAANQLMDSFYREWFDDHDTFKGMSREDILASSAFNSGKINSKLIDKLVLADTASMTDPRSGQQIGFNSYDKVEGFFKSKFSKAPKLRGAYNQSALVKMIEEEGLVDVYQQKHSALRYKGLEDTDVKPIIQHLKLDDIVNDKYIKPDETLIGLYDNFSQALDNPDVKLDDAKKTQLAYRIGQGRSELLRQDKFNKHIYEPSQKKD